MTMTTKNYFVFLLMTGLAIIMLAANPVFALPINPKEIIQIQDEAEKLSRIWQEQSIRKSQELYQKAARHWFASGNSQKSAFCLRQASKLNLMLNETDSALFLLKKSLYLEKKSGNTEGQAETLSFLAINSIKAEKIEDGEKFYKKAIQLSEQTGNSIILARADFAAGEFFYRKRNIPLMLEFQEKALNLFRQANDQSRRS